MRKIWLLTVAGLALTAAACGGDDDDTTAPTDAPAATTAAPADTAAPDEGSTDTTAAPDNTSDDGTAPDTTAPAAGGVSFDEVGRLLPAECQGDNVADEDSGVTEDTVNVSVLSIDFEPLASIGFAASNFDPTAAFETFVAAVNDAGGVCGRTIDVQRVLYDILQGQAGQACVEATEDRANLIVSISTYDQPRCITDTGLPALTGVDITEADMAATNGLLFTRFPSLDDQMRATVLAAHESGHLDGTVGVWYGSILAGYSDAVEASALPLLDELGVDYTAFRTDASGPNDPAGQAALQAAATDFASRGVDTVLSLVANTNWTGMITELHAQGLDPQFLSVPQAGNTVNELFAERFGTGAIAPTQQFATFTYGNTEIGEDDPIAAACNALYTELTGTVMEPFTFDYTSVTNSCVTVDSLVAAMSLAGGELNRASIVEALDALPPFRQPPLLGEVDWSADDRFGPDVWSVHDYDAATNTVATREATFSVD